MYYKKVPMTLEEAIAFESYKGFDSRDELISVLQEIAELYDVTFAEVHRIFYNINIPAEV